MKVDKARTIKVSQTTWKYLNQKKMDTGLSSVDSVVVWLINHKEHFKDGK